MLSVVIPTLNAEATLPRALDALAAEIVGEIVVADGGSTDDTAKIARDRGARTIVAPRGRGPQIAAGVAAASGDWLLLLHADTRLGEGWIEEAARFMAEPENANRAAAFRFALDDPNPAARRLERIVAWRCRTLALPYGDQGLLIRRDFLDAIGGIAPLPIMEDVDLARRIGSEHLVMLRSAALTSAARYRRGYLGRSLRNLSCLALYFAGLSPKIVARLYG